MSVSVQPGIQLCLQFSEDEHMTEEEEDLSGKEAGVNPSFQENRLWTLDLLMDSSERRPPGRTCRGRSGLWSKRGLFWQGQERWLKNTYSWKSSWETVKQVRFTAGILLI